MMQFDCRAVVVIDWAESPIGIVTARDIIRRVVAKEKNPLASPVRITSHIPVIAAFLDDAVDSVMTTMCAQRIRRVPILDATGRCLGLVSDTDHPEPRLAPRRPNP